MIGLLPPVSKILCTRQDHLVIFGHELDVDGERHIEDARIRLHREVGVVHYVLE